MISRKSCHDSPAIAGIPPFGEAALVCKCSLCQNIKKEPVGWSYHNCLIEITTHLKEKNTHHFFLRIRLQPAQNTLLRWLLDRYQIFGKCELDLEVDL